MRVILIGSVPQFQFIGGSLALDFVNTVGDRRSADSARDYFASPERIAEWLRLARLDPGGAGRISRGDVNRLVVFRETLYRLFAAIADGRSPRDADLDALNQVLSRARRGQRLVRDGSRYEWQWRGGSAADRATCEIALAAAALLLSDDRARISRCEDERCGWLFVDRSRGGRRRWCSMADCGNRAKARRHYRKHASASRRART